MNQVPVTIYTDGSCDKNNKNISNSGGYSAIIFDGPYPIKISGYEPNTTNQRMELQAVIQAMKILREPRTVEIYSDSAYICNCHKQKWYITWSKNGWKTSTKDDVANKDLWEEFIALVEFHDVTFKKVKGHSDDILNNECDTMAKDIISFYKRIKKELTI